jgi:hypothetical protein
MFLFAQEALMKTYSHVFFRLACAAFVAGITASGQTLIPLTSPGNTGGGPNGIGVTSGELLYTQPYCAGKQTRGIYAMNLPLSSTAPNSTMVAPIPEEGVCSENYLAISPGLGGFTAGDTFATGVSTTAPANEAVFRNGNTLFVNGLPASNNHAGVTFDTAGTFGFSLIVTLEGSARGYNSAGALQFTYNAPAAYVLEGATVAPLTYGACPGCLYITGELASNVNNPNPTGAGEIFVVTPGTPSGSTITPLIASPGPEPEGIVFVGSNLDCSLDGYSYFVSGYGTGADIDNAQSTSGAILAYTPASLASFAGQFLVPNEGSVGKPGSISSYSPLTNSFTTFSTTAYQLEGSAILPCLGNGCPATFGFWKNHAFPAAMLVNGVTQIGPYSYNATQLLAILNQNNAGGNAVTILGHQLIAAIANYDAGGSQNAAASAAIGSAIALLDSANINLSTSFVQAGTALGGEFTALADTLNTYNSSAPSCEGNGLSTTGKLK